MLALLFPGQGSNTPGDRDEVARLAPALLGDCIAAVGTDPFPLVADSTQYAQPALFCTSLARTHLGGMPHTADALAGHSLGELTALTAAGALSIHDGLALVVERARLMAAAPPGGMVVVKSGIHDATAVAEASGLVVAGDNAPGQVVLSGALDRLAPAVADARSRGLKAIRLGVAGAFHSPLMAGAAEAFAARLSTVEFRPTEVPVYCCATAAPFEDPRRQLAAALTEPVRWRETVLALEAAGVSAFAEVGPGRVLDGLVRRILPDAIRVPVRETSDVTA